MKKYKLIFSYRVYDRREYTSRIILAENREIAMQEAKAIMQKFEDSYFSALVKKS